MSDWARVRGEARRRHATATAALVAERRGCAEATPDSWALLLAAAQQADIELCAVLKGDPRLGGAVAQFSRDWGCILYDVNVGMQQSALNVAHEFGHVWLDGAAGAAHCTTEDIDPEAAEPGISGTDRVAGYGPAELRERRANVFAREFLLPAPEALRLYELGQSPDEIARGLGLPRSLVMQQLSVALLAPDEDALSNDAVEEGSIALDKSQRRAATVKRGPLLVEAGPGTGKTRTLVARILHLLERGAKPEKILALTFSNRAAEEMRERIARSAPAAAERLWIGTFHAFALDLLRRFYAEAGLEPRFGVIDPADALALLEDGLSELKLVEYRNLRAPGRPLRDVLAAIARAQDEDADPARYAAFAAEMLRTAESNTGGEEQEKLLRAAKRATEIARVYAWYDRRLRERGVVDFGGLLCRAIALLHDRADVLRTVRNDYTAVLVDEYQDVNRASGLLLQLIAGRGRGLWVVGDPRQAIYRFRGASPANIARFARDFPGARHLALRRNYRSRPAVLNAVNSFAATMSPTTAARFSPWVADRPPGGAGVLRTDAPDRAAEGVALGAQIEELRRDGVPYREQAVLCRTHAVLARMGAALDQAGVPSLYLGNLFERPEVRDLLAVLELLSGSGRALLRVATLPEYGVPASDIALLLRAAKERNEPFPAALALAADSAELSPHGRDGFRRLAEQLRGLQDLGPDEALTEFLIARSGYLREHSAGASHAQQRLALYQLLQFAREQRRARPSLTAAELLRRIRRLALYGDERGLRQLPERAGSLDAVRLLTVHAAKGLEFAAVHLPDLGAGRVPLSRRGQSAPPPAGLRADGDDAARAHAAEEECLFFVALSRARESLLLSRPARLASRSSNPSPFLTRIDAAITCRRTAPASEAAGETPHAARSEEANERRRYTADELDLYLRCPQRYLYERVFGLDGNAEETTYYRFRKVVHGAVRPVLAGHITDPAAAQRRLDELWEVAGPYDDANARQLFEEASAIVGRALAHAARATPHERRTFTVPLAHGDVAVQPDNVELRDGMLRLQRMRLGRLGEDEQDGPIYALYQLAARQIEERSGASVRVETLALGDDAPAARPLISTPRKLANRLALYDAAIQGIEAGDYPATPSEERFCPSCPHYHICGAGGALPV